MKDCEVSTQCFSKQANPIINNNKSNFCSPQKFANSHINRINPDKSTFLNSNLLVSNILNHLSPTRSPLPPEAFDAYDNKDVELQKKREQDAEYKEKVEKVRNKAKKRTQLAQEQFRNQERQLFKQIEQIQIMKIEINEKSRDIMGRKEDTAYLGRNIFLQGEKFLKQMKEYHPSDCIVKTEATRMLMKECAKKKSRTAAHLQLNSEEVSQIMNSSSSTLNMSVSASMDAQYKLQAKASEAEKEKRLMSLIRNKSFETVLAEQKRSASWKGFSNNWAMGFYKNEDVISTKKKRRNKRSPKKYMNVSESNNGSLLEYNDLFSRHTSLKKYKQAFNTTASSYSLLPVS